MSTRVLVVMDQVKQIKIMQDKPICINCPGPRQVIEHAVLLNMPFLQGDQEACILQSLYNIQFEFDNIIHLSVGRVLNHQDTYTHALIIRFPSIQVLLEFYKSELHAIVNAKLTPFLYGKHVVDYSAIAAIEDADLSPKAGMNWVSLNFLRVKADVCSEEFKKALEALTAVAEHLDYVKEITAGPNLDVADRTYTHSYAMYFNSVEGLEKVQKNPQFTKVLQDKVLPLCVKNVFVKFLAYKPCLCAL